MAALRKGAEIRIAQLRAEATQTRAAAEHWARQGLNRVVKTDEALLAATQQGQAWDRALRQLEAGMDPGELVQHAGAPAP